MGAVRWVTDGRAAVLLTEVEVVLRVVATRWVEDGPAAVLPTAVEVVLRVVVTWRSAGRVVDDLSVAVVVVLRAVVVFWPAVEPVPVLYEVASPDLRVVPVPLVAVLVFCARCAAVLLSPLPVEVPACNLVFRVADVLA